MFLLSFSQVDSGFSVLNPLHLRRGSLSSREISLVSHLFPNQFGFPQPLFSGEDLAKLLIRLWPDLLGDVAPYSVYRNLLSGERYADREYFTSSGAKKGELFLFRKGLLRAYPMPASRTRFKYWYGFPRERYRLHKNNFRSSFPPHDAFSSWCLGALTAGLGSSQLSLAPRDFWSISHSDHTGNYVVDVCYKVPLADVVHYWWIEFHTGSEGYSEVIFLKRLLTMEHFLRDRVTGHYVILVPFAKDCTKAAFALESYNKSLLDSSDVFRLHKSQITSYKNLSLLRQQMGFYQHRTR